MELGYACINLSLPDKTTNRTMRLATFKKQGLPYASKLALANVQDLVSIIEWNEQNNIRLFRMSSNIFPWQSAYELEELPDYLEIRATLEKAGALAAKYGHRITTHPGPYNVLSSPNKNVVDRTLRDLRDHAIIMDIMGLSNTPYNKINIHVGGVYGDKTKALETWCRNFELLPANVKSRLTIENDDKLAAFTTQDLLHVHKNVGIPIVFDYHHHSLNTGGLSEQEALEIACSTWGDITPACHVSEPRDTQNPRSHHDYVLKKINTYNKNVDIVLECKKKDVALLHYRKLHNI